MTATITNLPNPAANPAPATPPAPSPAPSGLDPTSSVDRAKAATLAADDLTVAARLLFVAAETHRRVVGDPELAARIDTVRADLAAVMTGKDTPSEIKYGDLAADASAYCDEVETLRQELESHGKGN